MISNLVRHRDSVEFDFVKDDRITHFKMSDSQDDEVTGGVDDISVAQYTSERLHFMAADQIAFLDGDFNPQFTASHPSQTLAQLKASEIKGLNLNFGENDFTEEEFVLF